MSTPARAKSVKSSILSRPHSQCEFGDPNGATRLRSFNFVQSSNMQRATARTIGKIVLIASAAAASKSAGSLSVTVGVPVGVGNSVPEVHIALALAGIGEVVLVGKRSAR